MGLAKMQKYNAMSARPAKSKKCMKSKALCFVNILMSHESYFFVDSMSKTEVEASAAFQSCRLPVVHLLFGCQGAPDAFALVVSVDIVQLGQDKQQDGQEVDGQQSRVATMVQGLVVFAVDGRGEDAASLDSHLNVC